VKSSTLMGVDVGGSDGEEDSRSFLLELETETALKTMSSVGLEVVV